MKKLLFNTCAENIILILSILIPIVVFCTILHDVFGNGDILDGILSSSLPISLLSVIILFIARSCKKMEHYAVIIWILSSFFSLLTALLYIIYSNHGASNEAVTFIFIYSIYILGLPCSLIFISFIAISVDFISKICNIYSDNDIYSLIIMWIALYFSMYMQWFVLFPWILRDSRAQNEHIERNDDEGST